MKVERISTSDEMPVKLEQLKEHLRILSNDFDSILSMHLKAAIASAGEFIGQVLWSGDFRITGGFQHVIKTGIMPISSIISASVDEREIHVDEICIENSVIIFPDEINGKKIKIEFSAGFTILPFDVTAAILLIAAKFFENPSDSVEQLPKASTNLLRPHKRWGR